VRLSFSYKSFLNQSGYILIDENFLVEDDKSLVKIKKNIFCLESEIVFSNDYQTDSKGFRFFAEAE